MRKKTIKAAYVVDLTNVTDIEETKIAFIVAKINAGQPLDATDIDFIIALTQEATKAKLAAKPVKTPVKKPWYKRIFSFGK